MQRGASYLILVRRRTPPDNNRSFSHSESHFYQRNHLMLSLSNKSAMLLVKN